jgi:thioredoxin-like negative regulator of GroEL
VPVTLAMLDATLPDNAALAARFGVTGYPTLKMFRDHSSVEGMQDFSGGRDADDIVSYLTKQAGTAAASTKLHSAADVATLAQKEEVVIVRELKSCIARHFSLSLSLLLPCSCASAGTVLPAWPARYLTHLACVFFF